MNFIRKNDNFNDLIIGKKAKEVPFQGSNIRTFIPLTLQEISSGCKKTIHISPEKKCRNCMGRGSKDKKNTLIPCNKCSGKGKGRIVGLAETAACTICLGTGKIPENPCPVCHGKGICPQETEIEVVFPKGISEGNFIILYSLGNAGIRGNNSGDLILFIEEELDEKYIRRGYDIETELTIPMTSAVLGETFEVEDIYGQKQSFRIKPGTQPEDFVKIEGKGLPAYKNDRVGDFYIHIHVEIPKMLSDEAHQYFSNFVKQIDSVNDNRVPRKIGKYYIIDFDPGEKETNYRSAFKKAETLLASTKNPIAFNLSKIDIIDSVTIGMMLKIHLKLNAHKSALTLIGLSDMIFETMKDCSLDMIFTIIDNESCLD
jgi:DnaJ-class molecular chaperone